METSMYFYQIRLVGEILQLPTQEFPTGEVFQRDSAETMFFPLLRPEMPATNGDFLKWRYPKNRLVYSGKSI